MPVIKLGPWCPQGLGAVTCHRDTWPIYISSVCEKLLLVKQVPSACPIIHRSSPPLSLSPVFGLSTLWSRPQSYFVYSDLTAEKTSVFNKVSRGNIHLITTNLGNGLGQGHYHHMSKFHEDTCTCIPKFRVKTRPFKVCLFFPAVKRFSIVHLYKK